jgi:hypothetical protein
MNAQTVIETPLAKLREPFPAHQISTLPKPYKKDSPKGKCNECGGYHGLPAVHLDYVGHAALTDRLLDTDIEWTWEPLSVTPEGLPAFDRNGGLWIKLTVAGVTRLGYGHAGAKQGGDAVKEIIGDALRNAAMRFGAALDLWHKGDLHQESEADDDGGISEDNSGDGKVSRPDPATHTAQDRGDQQPEYAFPPGPATGITQLKAMARNLWREIDGCGDESELDPLLTTDENKAIMAQLAALENPAHREIWEGDGKDNPGLAGFINRKRAELQQLEPNILRAG